MTCDPTGGARESRVNEGLRQGWCAGSADSCDNYRTLYYNLMLNIRFDGSVSQNTAVCRVHSPHAE